MYVEEHVPTQEMQTWISNKHFALLTWRSLNSTESFGWLNTSLISAAQILLREQCSAKAGPCLAQLMGFQVVSDEFVQIVHHVFGHWLTITNNGASSGAEVMAASINIFVKKQIATIVKTTESEIVNMMDM